MTRSARRRAPLLCALLGRPARPRAVLAGIAGLAVAGLLAGVPGEHAGAQDDPLTAPAPVVAPTPVPSADPPLDVADDDDDDGDEDRERERERDREPERERDRGDESDPDAAGAVSRPEPAAPPPSVAPSAPAPPPPEPTPAPPQPPEPPPPPEGPAAPPTLAAGLLTPAPGARVGTLRPVLAWRGLPGGTGFVNLQVFRIDGGRAVKVLSVFPRGQRARVPSGTLRSGERYVWRVWPHRGARGYTAQALATSYFDVSAPPRLTASARQLRINQRIAQAAVRRANALQGWLDEGIVAGDLRDGSLAADAFDDSVVTAGTPEPAPGAASPRPLVVPPPARAGSGPVRLDRAQLLVNQRISQAAIRRLNGLAARLDAGLTGADVREGAVIADKLAPGLTIRRTRPAGDPSDLAPSGSETAPPPPRAAPRAAVRLSAAQLRINQRIAQGAVRRAAALEGRIAVGLTGADLRPQALASHHLGPDLARP